MSEIVIRATGGFHMGRPHKKGRGLKKFRTNIIDFGNREEGRCQKSQNSADVIYGSHPAILILLLAPDLASHRLPQRSRRIQLRSLRAAFMLGFSPS